MSLRRQEITMRVDSTNNILTSDWMLRDSATKYSTRINAMCSDARKCETVCLPTTSISTEIGTKFRNTCGRADESGLGGNRRPYHGGSSWTIDI